MFLYRGLSHGDMSVVVPVTDVGDVAFPVLVGVTLLNDRPSILAWLGIAFAVPALWQPRQRRGCQASQHSPSSAACWRPGNNS